MLLASYLEILQFVIKSCLSTIAQLIIPTNPPTSNIFHLALLFHYQILDTLPFPSHLAHPTTPPSTLF